MLLMMVLMWVCADDALGAHWPEQPQNFPPQRSPLWEIAISR